MAIENYSCAYNVVFKQLIETICCTKNNKQTKQTNKQINKTKNFI